MYIHSSSSPSTSRSSSTVAATSQRSHSHLHHTEAFRHHLLLGPPPDLTREGYSSSSIGVGSMPPSADVGMGMGSEGGNGRYGFCLESGGICGDGWAGAGVGVGGGYPFPETYGYPSAQQGYPYGSASSPQTRAYPSLGQYTHGSQQQPRPATSTIQQNSIPTSPFPLHHPHPQHHPRPRALVSSQGSLSRALAEPGYGTTIVKGVLKRSVEFGIGRPGPRHKKDTAQSGRRRNGEDKKEVAGRKEDPGGSSSGMMGKGKEMGGLAALIAEEAERLAGLGGSDSDSDSTSERGQVSGQRRKRTRPNGLEYGRKGDRDDDDDDDETDGDGDEGAWGVEVVISLRRFDVVHDNDTRLDQSLASARGKVSPIDLTVDVGPPPVLRPANGVTTVIPPSSPPIARPVRGTHARTGSLLGQHPMSGPIVGPSSASGLGSRNITPAAGTSVNTIANARRPSSARPGSTPAATGPTTTTGTSAPTSTQPQAQKPPAVRRPMVKKPKTSHECSNCGITESVTWRQRNGQKVCNACGMYWNAKRQMRPKELWGNSQKSLKKKKQAGIDVSSDQAGPSTSTSLVLPLSSSFAPNVPDVMSAMAPPSPASKPTTSIYNQSRFHTQSLQLRKRARFEDQVVLPHGIGGPVGPRGLTARGLTASGFKRTLSAFAEGESVARAEKRRATRGDGGVGGDRLGMDRTSTLSPALQPSGDKNQQLGEDQQMSDAHDQTQQQTLDPTHQDTSQGGRIIGLGLPLSDDSGNTIINTTVISTSMNTTLSEPPLAPPLPQQTPLTAHSSLDFNGLIDWDANTDLEALFRLSQESGFQPGGAVGGSQEAVAMTTVLDGHGDMGSEHQAETWMGVDLGMTTVAGVRTASTSEQDMAYLRTMFMDGATFEGGQQHAWTHQSVERPYSQELVEQQHPDSTPEFDFSQLPPSSPPLATTGMEKLGHSAMLLSSPGTSSNGSLGYGF